MEQELTFRIILENPPPGVDFGLQKGGGSNYEVTQKQRSKTGDLHFEFNARVKEGKMDSQSSWSIRAWSTSGTFRLSGYRHLRGPD